MEDMRRFSWIVWFLIDAVLVVVFAASGRSSHQEDVTALGTLHVAWPFLVGLVVALVVSKGPRTIQDIWPWGIIYWVVTVVVGMLVRFATGGGFAMSFLGVTFGVLGLFLLGRRAVAHLIIRNRVKLRD
jgi:peptidoglycan/LPS O-acetylase OafA/YrhL